MEAIGPRMFLVGVILHALLLRPNRPGDSDEELSDQAITLADKTLDAMGWQRKPL